MAPMMQPLPRPIGRKKFRSEELREEKLKAARSPKSTLVLAGVLVALSAVAIGYGLWISRPTYKPLPPPVLKSAGTVVEHDNKWLDKTVRQEQGPWADHMRQRLAENPNLQPGHRLVRTGLVRINMRTLEDKTIVGGEQDRKPAAAAPE